MTRAVSFYDPVTGRLTGETFSGPPTAVAANVALAAERGLAAVEGEHDARTDRVNLQTGQVERWRPPPPSADHEWHDDAGAWKLSARAIRRDALARIHALESAQPRALRELALADVYSAQRMARERLQRIDDEISQLRDVLASLS